MKEYPILFSTPMVQAILEGRKTQTRRVVKNIPDGSQYLKEYPAHNAMDMYPFLKPDELQKPDNEKNATVISCPFGKIGDRIWVRETWKPELVDCAGKAASYYYLADNPDAKSTSIKFKPSIHMPKAAARIWLEITEVKVERLQDISEEDAIDEGIHVKYWGGDKTQPYAYRPTVPSEELVTDYDRTPEESFQKLWQSINGGESWEANPWVWVVKFKVLSTTGKPDIHAL
jgi:hypothetical protein